MVSNSSFIPFPDNCIEGRFLRREKRFIVYIDYNGKEIAIHSNNSGSMIGLLNKGMTVLASPALNSGRKLLWTQEAVKLDGFWVGVNTSIPNRMIENAFHNGDLQFAKGYTSLKREFKHGKSRIDALLEAENKPPLWVECKNVTMVEDCIAMFPDAISSRAYKHIEELVSLIELGHRAALFCLIQRPDAKCFGPAEIIDKQFADKFWWAISKGLEVYPYQGHVNALGVSLATFLPLIKRH